MRVSAVSQRSLSGIFYNRIPVTRPIVRDLRSRIVTPRLSRAFYTKNDPRLQLDEFFSRVQWPTTKAEEADLVESVGNAIWEGHSGGKFWVRGGTVDLEG